MKNFRILAALLAVVMMLTLLEGCFKKGENDPWISLYSRKHRLTGDWDINSFSGTYNKKLMTGEKRNVELEQSSSAINETIEYLKMTAATQDSLKAGQDTTIVWKGKVIEAHYKFNKDGTFEYVYEYSLEKNRGKNYEEGSNTVGIFAPTNKAFRMDSTITRNYRTEYSGHWNFLDKYDGFKSKERITLEVEKSIFLFNLSTTYVYDAEDDDDVFPNPVDTTFSKQSLTSSTNKYSVGEKSIVWQLDKLKNKELTLLRNIDQISTVVLGTSSDGGKASSTSGSERYDMIKK